MGYSMVVWDWFEFWMKEFIGKERGYKELNMGFGKYVFVWIKVMLGMKLGRLGMIGGNSDKGMGGVWEGGRWKECGM